MFNFKSYQFNYDPTVSAQNCTVDNIQNGEVMNNGDILPGEFILCS